MVTGANTGLGFHTARLLAERGATVVLACRNAQKAADAAARIGTPTVRTLQVDLASLASVRRAAEHLRSGYPHIDLLINNAGGIRPRYQTTEDGFELTFATNHLGPYAFTGLVLDRMLGVPGSRVVTVSSIGHRRGTINFDDLHATRRYRYTDAYFQAKLANLMFTYELDRRLTAAGVPTIALAAHPGNARTELGREMPIPVRLGMRPELRALTWWLLQSPQRGAPHGRASATPFLAELASVGRTS